MIDGPIRDHFLHQAEASAGLGSLFTATLCGMLPDILDETTATGSRIARWAGDPRADALALRLCGGLHRLVLTDADPALAALYPPHATEPDDLRAALPSIIRRNDAALSASLDSPPQTNEVARSAMLLPGFLVLARRFALPMEVCEIGASAGLNLQFDRFRYTYGSAAWGDAASTVHLQPEVRGDPPPLDGTLTIRDRGGCDIAPIDCTDPDQRLRLRSYVWADQRERLARLDAALGMAVRHPAPIERADAGAHVERRLAARRPGTLFVVFHSIMWQYMPKATRETITGMLADAGVTATAEAPLARLRMEPLDPKQPHATLSLATWPGGATERLARCDYHGRWIEWLGS